jgi:hypothetical protein
VFAGFLNKGFRDSLALLVILFLLAFAAVYMAPMGLESDHYPNLFYNYFTQHISGKLLITFLNFLFIGMGVFLVSLIAVNQEVVDKLNYFPVFLYLLIAVVCVQPHQVTPQLLTNVFIFYSIYKLLDTYRNERVLSQIFEGAFVLGCSAFITISSVISIPLFFIILLILRTFYWREWVIALLGFITPVFIYECTAYLTNFNRWYLFDATILYFESLRPPSFSEYYIAFSIGLFALLIIGILSNLVRGFGNTVKKQRARTILLWFLLFSLPGFFSGGANSSSIILTYALPLSLFIGDLLFNLRRTKIANTILAALIFCAILVFLGEYGVL